MIYPTECCKVKKKNTLSVDAKLYRAQVKDGQNPLEIFDQRFSRFVFSIIETGVQSVSANIPIRDFAGIYDATKTAMLIEKITSNSKTENDTNSPAYTVRIASGKAKGKTPAQVLSENPDGESLLNTQYKFLEKNLTKYPKNKEQMDAIVDAARLKKEGRLNTSASPVNVELYNIGIKSLKNRSKTNGKCFVYSISITWESNEDCPVVIRIENYYAYSDDSGGMIKVDVNSREDYKNQTFRLTKAQWSYVLDAMRDAKDIYKNAFAEQCIAESATAETDARMKAGDFRKII